MRKVISYGGGVGSTALICQLIDHIDQYEIIFVDHGGVLPETYDYVQYIQNELDICIKSIKPPKPLYNILWEKGWVPSIHWRACTQNGKLDPFYRHVSGNAEVYLGITWDEKHRAKENKLKRIQSMYPLVTKEITRSGAEVLIRQTGVEVPCRSGCYFCPFQNREQWRRLYDIHPDLFEKAVNLELNAQKHREMSTLLKNGREISNLFVEFQEQRTLDECYIQAALRV